MGKRFYAKYKYELVDLLSQMFPQDANKYKRYTFNRLKAIYASIHERHEKKGEKCLT